MEKKHIEELNKAGNDIYNDGYKRGWNACRDEMSHTAERIVYYTKDGAEIKTYKYTIPARK